MVRVAVLALVAGIALCLSLGRIQRVAHSHLTIDVLAALICSIKLTVIWTGTCIARRVTGSPRTSWRTNNLRPTCLLDTSVRCLSQD